MIPRLGDVIWVHSRLGGYAEGPVIEFFAEDCDCGQKREWVAIKCKDWRGVDSVEAAPMDGGWKWPEEDASST
jgi:hypothetical protein